MNIPKLPNDIIIKIWSMAKEMEYKEQFRTGKFAFKCFRSKSSFSGKKYYDTGGFQVYRRMPKTIRLAFLDSFYPLASNFRIKKDEKGEYIKIDDYFVKYRKIKVYACDLKKIK